MATKRGPGTIPVLLLSRRIWWCLARSRDTLYMAIGTSVDVLRSLAVQVLHLLVADRTRDDTGTADKHRFYWFHRCLLLTDYLEDYTLQSAPGRFRRATSGPTLLPRYR